MLFTPSRFVLKGSRREAQAARLIVWPEQKLLVFDDDEPRFSSAPDELAADERVYLAMGMGTIPTSETVSRSKTISLKSIPQATL